jgi:hypothetical protein
VCELAGAMGRWRLLADLVARCRDDVDDASPSSSTTTTTTRIATRATVDLCSALFYSIRHDGDINNSSAINNNNNNDDDDDINNINNDDDNPDGKVPTTTIATTTTTTTASDGDRARRTLAADVFARVLLVWLELLAAGRPGVCAAEWAMRTDDAHERDCGGGAVVDSNFGHDLHDVGDDLDHEDDDDDDVSLWEPLECAAGVAACRLDAPVAETTDDAEAVSRAWCAVAAVLSDPAHVAIAAAAAPDTWVRLECSQRLMKVAARTAAPDASTGLCTAALYGSLIASVTKPIVASAHAMALLQSDSAAWPSTLHGVCCLERIAPLVSHSPTDLPLACTTAAARELANAVHVHLGRLSRLFDAGRHSHGDWPSSLLMLYLDRTPASVAGPALLSSGLWRGLCAGASGSSECAERVEEVLRYGAARHRGLAEFAVAVPGLLDALGVSRVASSSALPTGPLLARQTIWRMLAAELAHDDKDRELFWTSVVDSVHNLQAARRMAESSKTVSKHAAKTCEMQLRLAAVSLRAALLYISSSQSIGAVSLEKRLKPLLSACDELLGKPDASDKKQH